MQLTRHQEEYWCSQRTLPSNHWNQSNRRTPRSPSTTLPAIRKLRFGHINPTKCELGRPDLSFLWHHISVHGIPPLSERVKAVNEVPPPADKKKLKEFLGMVNFYHRFIPHCAGRLHLLHQVLSSSSFTWSAACQEAYQFCKSALANATLLVHPQRDAPTSITSDASENAVGSLPFGRGSRVVRPGSRVPKTSNFDWLLIIIINLIYQFNMLMFNVLTC